MAVHYLVPGFTPSANRIHPRLFVCDLLAERPASRMIEGDKAFVFEDSTGYLWTSGAWGVDPDPSWAGGIAGFTASQSTAAPNDTVFASALTASGSATDIDAAIVPKGAGAFQLAVPDGTTTGGNKRGVGAVDLQLARSDAAHVAAADYSFAAGSHNRISADSPRGVAIGYLNSVDGNGYAGVAIGSQNTVENNSLALGENNDATAEQCTAIGRQNEATANKATAIGRGNSANGIESTAVGGANGATENYATAVGQGNAAEAVGATCLGKSNDVTGLNGTAIGNTNEVTDEGGLAFGVTNVSSGKYSAVVGGQNGGDRGVIGANIWPGNSDGNTQRGEYLLRGDTADATPTTLDAEGSGTSTAANTITLLNTSSYYCDVKVIARNTSTGDSKSWTTSALIHREANAASTAIIGVPVVTSDFGSAGLSTASVAVSANTTLGGLEITATGIAATNIRWLAFVRTVEVTN